MTDFLDLTFGLLYRTLFGCRHRTQTRPFTLDTKTYKVCLNCSRQILYSCEQMTPLSHRELRRMKAAHVASR